MNVDFRSHLSWSTELLLFLLTKLLTFYFLHLNFHGAKALPDSVRLSQAEPVFL